MGWGASVYGDRRTGRSCRSRREGGKRERRRCHLHLSAIASKRPSARSNPGKRSVRYVSISPTTITSSEPVLGGLLRKTVIAQEAIDDPVFGHPKVQILSALVFVVSRTVAPRPRDKLDHDRGNIPDWVGTSSRTDPDHAVGAPAIIRRADVAFRECQIERRSLRATGLVVPEHHAELFIRIALGLGQDWGHDQDSIDQLVRVSAHRSR